MTTDYYDLIEAAIVDDANQLDKVLSRIDVNATDDDGWTALHIAARQGSLNALKCLLKQPNVDVNSTNRWKSTPLMLAAGVGNAATVEHLLGHPLTQINLQAEYYRRTALIEACAKGYLAVVKLLIAHGADVNVMDKTGRNSALIEAIKNRHIQCTVFLLRTGLIDFAERDLRVQALIWAGSFQSTEIRTELNTAIERFFARRSPMG